MLQVEWLVRVVRVLHIGLQRNEVVLEVFRHCMVIFILTTCMCEMNGVLEGNKVASLFHQVHCSLKVHILDVCKGTLQSKQRKERQCEHTFPRLCFHD